MRGFASDAAGSSGASDGSSAPGATAARSPQSTVSQREAAKFAALAGEWWDPRGPFAPLHAMNPVRCAFLRAALCSTFGRDARAAAPLAGLRLLDVGCGGGLLAESLARMGAHVTGVDVNEGGLATAEAHAALDPGLAGRLTYRAATAEQLAAAGEQYDAGKRAVVWGARGGQRCSGCGRWRGPCSGCCRLAISRGWTPRPAHALALPPTPAARSGGQRGD